MTSVVTRYQIALAVVDQPGVLATIAGVFAEHSVSVEAVSQSIGSGEEGLAPTATLVIVTHEASESSLRSTVEALKASSVVSSVVSVLRVEGL
jgi:homoserine dehydrogenase